MPHITPRPHHRHRPRNSAAITGVFVPAISTKMADRSSVWSRRTVSGSAGEAW
jgi:hypothetical protein